MKLRLFPALQYLDYYLRKEDRHSLQSPFVYQLYQGLKKYTSDAKHQFSPIEQWRNKLLRDNTQVIVEDLGAGSHRFSSQKRKISAIARYSCSTQKFNLLYQYLCTLTPAQTVVELGTCLGITSCYLAEVTQGLLYTFEGAAEIVDYTKKDLEKYKKIRLISGDISKTLPTFLYKEDRIDFAFIDANHTYKHTLNYYEQLSEHIHEASIMVIGDIHWSREMKRAWEEIIGCEKVRLSLDFYECGILIFRKGMDKKHYVLNY